MKEEKMIQLIDDLNLEEGIEVESIPNIDLYMDQVITLFEDKLQHTKRHSKDKLLTKTMINNYTKDKLLMPAKKKKYTKEHILLMIILYELKQVLTISDIKDLFGTVIKDNEVDSSKLAEIYKIYLEFKVCSKDYFQDEVTHIEEFLDRALKDMPGELEGENDKIRDMVSAIILIEKANAYKRLAEKIIDCRINDEKDIK